MSLLTELAEEWRERAACRGVGVEIFFAERGGSTYEEALKICARCPVRTECLNYALRCEPVAHGHRMGVWGGVLPGERKRMMVGLGRMHECSECHTNFSSTGANVHCCSPACRRARTNRLAREERAQRALEMAS